MLKKILFGKPFYLSGWKLVFLLEALALLGALLLQAVPEKEFVYAEQNLVSKYGVYLENFLGEYGNGYYLDNSIHPSQEDLDSLEEGESQSSLMTISTPAIDLHPGSYEISLTYVTDDNTQTCIASSEYNTYPVITERGNMDLNPKYNEHKFSLYTPLGVKGYQVRVEYSDCGYLFISDITIRETSAWKNVTLFLIASISFFLDAFFLFIQKFPRRMTPAFKSIACGLVLLTVFTSAPVLTFYLPGGDDLNFHLYRIEAIKNALSAGQFPVRIPYSWLNGYGYANSIFYGELFLYIPAILRLVGFTVQAAYKIYLIGVNLATVLIAFYCFRRIFLDSSVAFLGTVAYALAPYRLLCLYLRASVGEYSAVAFFPLVALGIYLIYTQDPCDRKFRKNWIPAVLGFSGIIQCHTISTLMAGLFTVLICLILFRKTLQPKRLLQLLKVVGYTVLLNFWFLIPFLDYIRFDYNATVAFTPGRFAANGAFFSQLFSFFPLGTGSSFSVAEGLDSGFDAGVEMSYTLGAGLTAAEALYLMYRIRFSSTIEGSEKRKGDLLFAFGALALFMTTIWFPWDFIQQLNKLFFFFTNNIQFPWRFLGIASLFATLTLCFLLRLLQKRHSRSLFYTSAAVFGLLAFISGSYFLSDYSNTAGRKYIQEEYKLNSMDVMLGEYLPIGTSTEQFSDTSVKTENRLSDLSWETGKGTVSITCTNNTPQETYVDVPLLSYKGYTAADIATNKKLAVVSGENNRVRVIVPANYQGTFKVQFTEPIYWRISELISLGFILTNVGFWLFHVRKNTRSST